MKAPMITSALSLAISLFLLTLPTLAFTQPELQSGAPLSIEQPLVREGLFAVKLNGILGLRATDTEAEAEDNLGTLGIAPRNGWIADYPVTPDIIAELRRAVSDAVDSGSLKLTKDDALRRLDNAAAEFGLSIVPYGDSGNDVTAPDDSVAYPDTTAANSYYYDEGPPVVTYFTPPPDFYYLYAWVPFPFWCAGIRFPGYFILHDFHRPFHFGHRRYFVSNHFNDFRSHRIFRIDPVERLKGRTFAGIGARGGNFLSSEIRKNAGGFVHAQGTGSASMGGPGGPALTGDRSQRTGMIGQSAPGAYNVPSTGSYRPFSHSASRHPLTIPPGWSRTEIRSPKGMARWPGKPRSVTGVYGAPDTATRALRPQPGIRSHGYLPGSIGTWSSGHAHPAPAAGAGTTPPSYGGGRTFTGGGRTFTGGGRTFTGGGSPFTGGGGAFGTGGRR